MNNIDHEYCRDVRPAKCTRCCCKRCKPCSLCTHRSLGRSKLNTQGSPSSLGILRVLAGMTLCSCLHRRSAAPVVLQHCSSGGTTFSARQLLEPTYCNCSATLSTTRLQTGEQAGRASKREQAERATQLQLAATRSREAMYYRILDFVANWGGSTRPLAAIAFAYCAVTFLSKKQLGAVQSLRYTTCVSHASARACILLDS